MLNLLKTSIVVFIVTFTVGCGNKKVPRWELDYQRATDPKRVEDVHKIAELVEKFHEKAGRYPLTNGDFKLPVDVPITKKKYNWPASTVQMHTFEEKLNSVLGSNTKVPVDPQKVDALGGRRLYWYYSDGKDYIVSAYLFFETANTRSIGPYTHKYQVGSTSVPEKKIFKFDNIKQGGNLNGLANDYENIGLFYLGRGSLDDAEDMFNEGLRICERLGLEQDSARNFKNLGVVYNKRGEKDKARRYWTESRDLYAKIEMFDMAEDVQKELNGLEK